MSATGRKKKDGSKSERDATDFYETPRWCAEVGFPYHLGTPTIVIDPCAGRGALLDAAMHRGVIDAIGFEIDPALIDQPFSHEVKNAECVYFGDGLSVETRERALEYVSQSQKPEKVLVLENPPFKLGEAFAKTWDVFAYACASAGHEAWVSHLSRLGWLAHQRSEWLATIQPDVGVLSRRPSFKGGPTDASDYCWVQWGYRGEARGTVVRRQVGRIFYILDDRK